MILTSTPPGAALLSVYSVMAWPLCLPYGADLTERRLAVDMMEVGLHHRKATSTSEESQAQNTKGNKHTDTEMSVRQVPSGVLGWVRNASTGHSGAEA